MLGLAYIIIVFLILIYIILIIKEKNEAFYVPGVRNRYKTEASFLDDRAEFEANEQKFYGRYRT